MGGAQTVSPVRLDHANALDLDQPGRLASLDVQGSAADRLADRREVCAWLAGAALLASTGAARAQTGAALSDVVVSVPGPGNSVSFPVELGIKLGLDRADGLALRLRYVGSSGAAMADLRSGASEFAVFSLPAAMLGNVQSAQLVALAALDDLPLHTLMVRADLRDKVQRVQDLRGRVVGVHATTLTAAKTASMLLLELLLENAGMGVRDVRLIAAGSSWETQSAALLSGAVDACMTDEPFGTRLADEKIAFKIFSTGDPAAARNIPGAGFLRATLISRADRVSANPALAERMVRMVQRSLAWIAQHSPAQMADALALDAPSRRSFVSMMQQYPRHYSPDGKFSAAQLADTQVFFRASNADVEAAQRYALDAMVVDRWAGRKP